jgi:hypothetical protein
VSCCREKHRKEAEEAEKALLERGGGKVSGGENGVAERAENGGQDGGDEEMVGPPVAGPTASMNGPVKEDGIAEMMVSTG